MKTLGRGKQDPRPTAISLFAGAGGCSLGFGQGGYDVRFATDLDADAVESYRRNFHGTPCEAADFSAWRGQFTPDSRPIEFERFGNCGELATFGECTTAAQSAFNPVEFDGIGSPGNRRFT